MKAQDIVDKLSQAIPKYTAGFSAAVNVISVAVTGTTATATTDAPHGLVAGQNVAVLGVNAPVQINVASFLRTGTTAIFETDQQHDLTLSERDKANGGKTITISGANEAEFNGAFVLIAVINRGDTGRDALTIAVEDSGPTTISGSPLVDNANGELFNGLFPATPTTDTEFTYTLPVAYPLDGAPNNATVQTSIRILSVLDIEQYLRDVYTSKGIDEDILVVQLGDVRQSKSRDEQTDAATSSSAEYSYAATLIQPFAVYIVMNVTDSLTAAEARDVVESEYVPAIFHAVLRAKFDTGFTYSGFRSTFTGHGVFAYSDENGKNKALYAHELTFEQLVQITRVDTVGAETSVAMRDVDYKLTTDLGSGELEADVDLDADAEPAE